VRKGTPGGYDNELLTEMYDIVLWQKNMITRSIEQQRLAVAASKDVLLKRPYARECDALKGT
jgi:hypothetical protein